MSDLPQITYHDTRSEVMAALEFLAPDGYELWVASDGSLHALRRSEMGIQ